MKVATEQSDSEAMRKAVAALQDVRRRPIPIANHPVSELWNIRRLLRDQRYEEAKARLTPILDWGLLGERP